MPVVSVSMPSSLVERIDEFVENHGYTGRSEAIREGARGLLEEFDDERKTNEPLVCVVTTLFDHESGAEAEMSMVRHSHDDLVTTNVHSHAGEGCVELFVLEGSADDLGSFVARIRAIDGITAIEYSTLAPGTPVLL